MNNPEHSVFAVQVTDKLPLKEVLKKVKLFKKIHKSKKDLKGCILTRYQAVEAQTTLPVRLCLVINRVKGGTVLDCPKCKEKMQGNGYSFKFVEQKERLKSGKAIYVIYCILCPQKCCAYCKTEGEHYCHKILPEATVYYRRAFSRTYEKGILGDVWGDMPFSDSSCVRFVKEFVRCYGSMHPGSNDAADKATRRVLAARGFAAVTAAARGWIQVIMGDNPAEGWFGREMNRYHLTVRFA